MATRDRLNTLTQKHQFLDNLIKKELQHPSVDTISLNRLKRKKLKIKQEIQHLAS